jgi:putative transposase
MDRIRERTHRLPAAAYRGCKAVAFTACVQDRRRGLAHPSIVEAFLPLLKVSCEAHGSLVPLYTFMPDHLHLVLCGMNDEAAPKRAFERFKWESGIWLQKNRPELRWQKDSYDRILRRKEAGAMLRYIALNPVRAGLAEDISAWPFTGCIGYDLHEVFIDAFW